MLIQQLTYPKKVSLTSIFEVFSRISLPGAKFIDQLPPKLKNIKFRTTEEQNNK